MFFYHIDVFHHQTAVIQSFQYITALALTTARDDNDFITFPNLVHNLILDY
jgi:hypothetical protein